MPSIVQILKSEYMLGSRDYSKPDNYSYSMFLYSKNNIITPESVVEFDCNVSDGHLGFNYGTPNTPHDPIDLGFAVTMNKNASMNIDSIAEQLHVMYNGSIDIDKVFTNVFPKLSGELVLHKDQDGIKTNICNKQYYVFSPVEKYFQDKIKKSYSEIMGYELPPF